MIPYSVRTIEVLPLTPQNRYLLLQTEKDYSTTNKAIIAHPIYNAELNNLINNIEQNYILLKSAKPEFEIKTTFRKWLEGTMDEQDRI